MMRFVIFIYFIFISLFSYAANEISFVEIIETGKWDKISQIKDKNKRALAIWIKLSEEKKSDFEEISEFIVSHPNWPRIEKFKLRIEEKKIENYSDQNIVNWFSKFPPNSLAGIKFYISVIKDPKIVKEYVKHIWSEDIFDSKEEQEFFTKYGKFLADEDHFKRINFFLFSRNASQARQALKYIPKKQQNIYSVRIKMLDNNLSVIKLNENHLNDVGVLHNLAHIHNLNDDDENLVETIIKASSLDPSYQKYFWKMKSKLIRGLILQKKYDTAYKFAITHGNSDIKDCSEAEWLAGWIALRFLNKPSLAIEHFKSFYEKVKMPISLSRGAYWLGRSYEKLGKKKESEEWYKIAAKYYTCFYGQLAICKINNCKLNLNKNYKVSQASVKIFENNPLVIAVKNLQALPSYGFLTREFLIKAISNSSNDEEIILITQFNLNKKNYNLQTEIAKHASYKNVVVLDVAYPIPKYVYSEHKIDHALVLALIRQESVFNYGAVSSAGAMGLMQMMPYVAQKTAKSLGIKFNKHKLLNDPSYNSCLGSNHVKELLIQYDNSYILAIAAYNAGSKPVNKWIEDNGDPRNMKSEEEIIDWLEKITFHETRNYVQRVLENRSIYHMMTKNTNVLPKILKQ